METAMNALSNDLRQRILNHALNHSVRQTADLFQVSPNTVHCLKKLYYETGGVAPRPCLAVHEHAISPEGEMYLKILLKEDVDLTLSQLCDQYEKIYGVRVGVSTMHNTLKHLGITTKKKLFTTRTSTAMRMLLKDNATSKP